MNNITLDIKTQSSEVKEIKRDIANRVGNYINYIKMEGSVSVWPHLEAGEVYEFDFAGNIDAEFGSRHYGLVIATSEDNDPLVLVAPIKTDKYGPHAASDVAVGQIGNGANYRNALVVINQVKSISKLKIYPESIIGKSREKVIELRESSRESRRHNLQNPELVCKLDDNTFSLVTNCLIRYIKTGKISFSSSEN